MKSFGKYSKEFIEKVREYYLSNEFSLEEISDNSTGLFGKNVPLADLKAMSRNDPNGAWSIIKINKGRRTEDVPMAEKILFIANKLYDQMVDPEEELPINQLIPTAKTWSDLIDKAKLTKETNTAKIPAQAAKDIFEEARAEFESNKLN